MSGLENVLNNLILLSSVYLEKIHYFQRFRTVFNSDKKVSENETVRNFKRPKILRYSTTPVRRNKPDVTRKDLEMTGIVKAVTKKLEAEDPFKILVVDF